MNESEYKSKSKVIILSKVGGRILEEAFDVHDILPHELRAKMHQWIMKDKNFRPIEEVIESDLEKIAQSVGAAVPSLDDEKFGEL